MHPKVVKRFFAKTSTDHDEWFEGTQCVLWTASAATKQGHGRFSPRNGEFWVVHRFAWAIAHGPIPDGMVVWHRCPNKLCVNDLHLELITSTESIRRSRARLKPQTHFRCCGRPRTAEHSYPNGRCRACHHEQMKAQRRKNDKTPVHC